MKKRQILFIIGLSLSISTFTQTSEQTSSTTIENSVPIFYLGTSTGTNGMNGIIGLNGEFQAYKGLTVDAGIGIGSWGFRKTIGLRLYKHYPKGVYYSASFSDNSGATEVEMDLETIDGSTETVELTLNKVQTINLAIGGQFAFAHDRFRLNLEGGYSIPLQTDSYEITSNDELSSDSELALDLNAPGGLIFAVGLSFGFK